MLLTKGDFAVRRGVSAAAVSQWISTGKLTGDALVGAGRSAKINVPVAEAQLGLSLDPGQQLARGGRSDAPAAGAPAGLQPPAPDPIRSSIDERYRLAKAEQAEIDRDRAKRKDLDERGIYVRADKARESWSRELSGLLSGVDEWLPDLAKVLAVELGGEPRALASVLKREWRAFRQKRSDLAKSAVNDVAQIVEDTEFTSQ